MPKVYEKDALKLGSYYLLRICYILILFFVSLKMKVTWGGFKFYLFLFNPSFNKPSCWSILDYNPPHF